MGDPGLHSKFVEMQQEAVFAGSVRQDVPRRNEGLQLDRARILEQLSRATNKRYIKMLRRALKSIESQL